MYYYHRLRRVDSLKYYNPVRFFGYGTGRVNVNKRLRLVREKCKQSYFSSAMQGFIFGG